MRKKKILTKEELIKAEENRLTAVYKDMESKQNKVVSGLIRRAAFMRISLNEMEDDINQNGYTESFSQGNQEPYQRKRPVCELYNTMNTNYQKIIKQLSDLLPKAEVIKKDDGFEDFVMSRDDVD